MTFVPATFRRHARAIRRPLRLLLASSILVALVSPALPAEAASGWTRVASTAGGGHLYDVSCVGAADCWAVGAQSRQALIEHFDGTSWAGVPGATYTAGFSELIGIDCLTATDCWAVGVRDTPPAIGSDLIEHFDGSSWSLVPGPGLGLFGVTCVSNNDCWASGNFGAGIEHFDGTSWSIAVTPTVTTTSGYALYRVRCPSANDCWAVGANEATSNPRQSLAEHFDGTAWSLAPLVHPRANDALSDVVCTATNDCSGVGCTAAPSSTVCDQNLVEHFNGTSWSVAATPNAPGSALSGVACANANDCWAVGGPSFGVENLIEHFDGASWRVVPSSVRAYALTCVANGECWAVGYDIDHYVPPAPPPPQGTPSSSSAVVVAVPGTGAPGEPEFGLATLLIAIGVVSIALAAATWRGTSSAMRAWRHNRP